MNYKNDLKFTVVIVANSVNILKTIKLLHIKWVNYIVCELNHSKTVNIFFKKKEENWRLHKEGGESTRSQATFSLDKEENVWGKKLIITPKYKYNDNQ